MWYMSNNGNVGIWYLSENWILEEGCQSGVLALVLSHVVKVGLGGGLLTGEGTTQCFKYYLKS